MTIVKGLNCRAPALVNLVFRETLIEYFRRPLVSSPVSVDDGGLHPSIASRGERLSAVLLALAHFSSTYSNNSRRDCLTELFVISHHQSLGTVNVVRCEPKFTGFSSGQHRHRALFGLRRFKLLVLIPRI